MKHTKIGLTAFVVITFLISASTVSAYQGDYTKKGPNYSETRHTAMTEVFASKDYEAWKKLMDSRDRALKVVTKDNFAKFVEAHHLAEEGKYDEADEIREELGLRTRNSKQTGHRNGQNQRTPQ